MIDRIGKVHVLATLGSGAHSSILHVRRDADSREYALKVVSIDGKGDLKYLEQAKHEYRVGQMLNHPNLGAPATGITSSTFGQITSKNGNRTVTAALRLEF